MTNNFIRIKRIQKGLSQKDLAEMIGITPGAVSQWEQGVSFPRPRSIPKVCAILDCTVEELLKAAAAGSDIEPSQNLCAS